MLVSLVVVSEVYWIVNYTPKEQYSVDVRRCSPEDLNISISMLHVRSIQPNNSLVVLANREIFGDQRFENLTQEQWLGNAESVFDWVIGNVGYEDKGDLFPASPGETIKAGSGDCDDLSILYMSMAINAGVPSDNIRLVIAGDRFTGSTFTCKPTHAYVELKYVYEGETIWMPVELTDKKVKFNQFTADLYMPGVRFYWLGYEKVGYFDDAGMGPDGEYEAKIRLFRSYADESWGIGGVEEVLVHAFNRHFNSTPASPGVFLLACPSISRL